MAIYISHASKRQIESKKLNSGLKISP